MKSSSITKEIDWFCWHAVSEGILDKETCVAIIEALEKGGIEPELYLIIQVMVENKLAPADGRIAELQKMAAAEAQTGYPSDSIFDESSDASVPEEPASAPSATTEPENVLDEELDENEVDEKRVFPDVKDLPVLPENPEQPWLSNWPDLSLAVNLGLEEAKELLNSFLKKARESNCSDIHITTGAYPFVRRYKIIYYLPQQHVLQETVVSKLVEAILPSEDYKKFETHLDFDFSYEITETDRYRTNLHGQRLGPGMAFRVISDHIIPIRELGFMRPEVVEKLTTYNQGLILVTGPAGCGKSTTLNSLVDYINQARHDHIVTIEDPIEIVHVSKNCNVTQRELNRHTKSFHNALKAVLREDPDIIVIGELRDLETIEMAIHSSETGHLVIGTLHTSSASSTMDRILDVFPPGQQSQIRSMVSESLKGVICQQLIPNIDGTGLVLVAEILLGTLAVSNMIREGKTYQLFSTIQTSRNVGMSTMEQSYFDVYMAGLRSYKQTIPYVKAEELLHQMQVNEAKMAKEKAEANGTKKKKGWF
ncbi:MAG: PilT/PilU family type 4a pilus ATPase [Lentisphaeria bacterium]